MKTAIEQGVKGGIDQSMMAEMIQRVVAAPPYASRAVRLILACTSGLRRLRR